MRRALDEWWHNPSSVHRAGQAARQQVELARQSIAELIGARPRDIVFTSGGTESIDLAIRGVLGASRPARALFTTRTEHAAVRELASDLEKTGTTVRWIPIERDGVVDVSVLASMLAEGSALVSVQWANNETGTIQPVEEIARLCGEANAIFHCDGTQRVGKEEARIAAADEEAGAASGLACDLLSFAPHKFHGPKGVGVLWTRQGVRLRPVQPGAQELGRRGGTENVPGIVGAGVAAREAMAWLARPDERARLGALRDLFEGIILGAIPDSVVNGSRTQRLWNTCNIGFPKLEAEALLLLLSERGVCASAGAACSSGSLDPSPVLLAMGVSPEIAHGSLRFSLSRETTDFEVREAAGVVAECVRRLRRSMA